VNHCCSVEFELKNYSRSFTVTWPYISQTGGNTVTVQNMITVTAEFLQEVTILRELSNSAMTWVSLKVILAVAYFSVFSHEQAQQINHVRLWPVVDRKALRVIWSTDATKSFGFALDNARTVHVRPTVLKVMHTSETVAPLTPPSWRPSPATHSIKYLNQQTVDQ